MRHASSTLTFVTCFACALAGCRHKAREPVHAPPPPLPSQPTAAVIPVLPTVRPPEPEPLADPVSLWEHGHAARTIDGASASEHDQLVVDLGESWAPYLFSEGPGTDGELLTNTYRATYLALARGDFGDDLHGRRAQRDKYLELYGIEPTLALLRTRMRHTASLACAATLDHGALDRFNGVVTYQDRETASHRFDEFAQAEARTLAAMRAQGVSALAALDPKRSSKSDLAAIARYRERLPEHDAVLALQARLRCEGFLNGKGKVAPGVMDWATHEALAEFERKNRVLSFGYIARESLEPLRQMPLESDRQAVLRVLVERAMQSAGVIEDGSAPSTFIGRDGTPHDVPDFAASLREALINAFDLTTPESTLAWLESLGELDKESPRRVAIARPPLPEYYAPEMDLTLDYDRGDVWYDFPYGDHGEELPQPVQRRPQVTISTRYNGQKIALARFGTTIGGWRSELVDGVRMWKYKGSPVGERVWDEIVAAPVWLPPDGTPLEDLLQPNYDRKLPSEPEYIVNYHELGPSYASAYGLVAAYHRTFGTRRDGSLVLGNDEGIRTHGSVDFMSIMRRHSHGCHRLHNHIALRLMSFVLAHRAHTRVGQERIAFERKLTVHDRTYSLLLQQGGYVFKLAQPLRIDVEEGRIRGRVHAPIAIAIPEYDAPRKGYFSPDGTRVLVRGDHLIPVDRNGRPAPPQVGPIASASAPAKLVAAARPARAKR